MMKIIEEQLLLHLDLLYRDVAFVIRSAFDYHFVTDMLLRQSLIVQSEGFLVGGAVENEWRPAIVTLHGACFVRSIVFTGGGALCVGNPSGVLVMICHQGDGERQDQAQAQQEGDLISHVSSFGKLSMGYSIAHRR
jgi:hypothetical protein